MALVLRLYKINTPLADWHSWRQADTAAVARNYARYGIDLLKPRYDDFSNVQTGHYNPEGLRYVEFPVYQSIFASMHRALPVIPIEVYGRFLTILFSLATISIVYYVLLHEESQIAAIAGALTFALFPFFVYYSRVVLPDMPAVSFMFMGIFFMYLYSKNSHKSHLTSTVTLCVSMVFTALALLTKPTVIFYLIPLAYLLHRKYGYRMISRIPTYVYFISAVLPLIAWRLFIAGHPEGIPVSDWLIFGVNTGGSLQNIFFRPSFFRWIFFERILDLILGGYMVVFLVAGIIKKPHKSFFLHSIGLAALLYLLTFQGGNVQHDYYQIIILPALALMVGTGVAFFAQSGKKLVNPILLFGVTIAMVAGSWLFSYIKVKDYYNISDGVLRGAQGIQLVTDPNDIIVTDTVGDTTLLYIADRRGYPTVTEDLHDMKKRGADYFVTDKPDVITEVKKVKDFTVVFESNKATIFRL